MSLLNSLVPGLGRSSGRLVPTSDSETRVRPVYSVREDASGYAVTVHLPGVAKSGLEITAQDNELEIVGRRAWTPPAEWTALYRETPRASFALTLQHEGEVDVGKIGAELKDGVLRLTLPKAEAAKPRKIAIG